MTGPNSPHSFFGQKHPNFFHLFFPFFPFLTFLDTLHMMKIIIFYNLGAAGPNFFRMGDLGKDDDGVMEKFAGVEDDNPPG